MNNVRRSIKKFTNPEIVHRSWNSIGNNYASVFKLGLNQPDVDDFLMFVFNRNTNKFFKYTSPDGKTWGNKVNVSAKSSNSNQTSFINPDFGNRVYISNGYYENGDIYLVVNSRSGGSNTFNSGYYILKNDNSNYNSFTQVKFIPIDGALDSAPVLEKFKGNYYIFGRYRGSEDWGNVSEILEDRRAVRINKASSITGQWEEIGVTVTTVNGNEVKTSLSGNILDPQKFYETYERNIDNTVLTYENATIKKDYYGFVSYNADGTLICILDTYFKNLNRPIIIRRDRSFDNSNPPNAVFGTGEEYPTIMLAKNAINFDGGNRPFIAVAAQNGDLNRTFAPNDATRAVGNVDYNSSTPDYSLKPPDYDIPSTYEKTQGFLGKEFGQFKPLMLVDAGDKILFYYANRIDTHYRSVSYSDPGDPGISYVNNAREDRFITDAYNAERNGRVEPNAPSYVNWYERRLAHIRTARGLSGTFNPDYEWAPITDENIIKDVPVRTANESTVYTEGYQKPSWIYVSEIPKNRFASWQNNGDNAYVDTKEIVIPSNADYIQINHIGDINVDIFFNNQWIDLGTVMGDNLKSELRISDYKNTTVKFRFNLLQSNSETICI
jgi:hypothetical protein